MGKREQTIKLLSRLIESISNDHTKSVNLKDYLPNEVIFDDEQPKIMSTKEILDSLRSRHNALVWTVDDVIAGIKKATEETHKRYKPLVGELKNLEDPSDSRFKTSWEIAEHLQNLIIKD